MAVFKAYDIRGLCPGELDQDLALKVGRSIALTLPGSNFAAGRDMRTSSPALYEAVIRGMTEGGNDVISLGLVSTAMTYFATGKYGLDGAVMITASHNPAEYNGIKISGRGAIGIGLDTGLGDIQSLIEGGGVDRPPDGEHGQVTLRDIMDDYVDHVLSFAGEIGELTVAVDAGNGMGGHTVPHVFGRLPCKLIRLYFELDGTFPNHPPNPLVLENLVDLQECVKDESADVGVAFDGDADRAALVDEKGQVIPGDLMTALLAKRLLKQSPGSTVLYDVRSSWAVKEEVEAAGGKAVMGKVGHAFMKKRMREENAIFAGELSSHYYFKENFCADDGMIAMLLVLTMMSEEKRPLSEIVAPLRRYHQSGEINSEVQDQQGKMKELEAAFSDGKTFHLDGLSVEHDDWWFNVRPSNTEPVLRLNLEAKDREKMEAMRDKVLSIIRS
jgi:phosphomannomutase